MYLGIYLNCPSALLLFAEFALRPLLPFRGQLKGQRSLARISVESES
jgi:hypothetical protein